MNRFAILSLSAVTGIAAYITYLRYNVAIDKAKMQEVQMELEKLKAVTYKRNILLLKLGISFCGAVAIYTMYKRTIAKF